jgi:predicted GNAT family acetyltransferase
MEDVKLHLNEKGKGAFTINEGPRQLGEMVVSVKDDHLTVHHTEVVPEEEGKGLAKRLLTAMVDYARNNQLRVIPLCPYTHAQFVRHPDLYGDLWDPKEYSRAMK